MNNNFSINNLRHSCAHLLAAAVLNLWPETKITIGPVIENGFYYDFEFNTPISEKDLAKIEKKMSELVNNWNEFTEMVVAEKEALEKFKDNPYKIELIKELKEKGEKITLYQSGDFIDLCRGGHIENPSKELKHFKLLSIAGAYWRGNEKNKMLTRIYGTCFPTEKELKDYLWQTEEAKKRDHRKIGVSLKLFHLQSSAPGMPFWHPKGVILRNQLIEFSRQIQNKYNYLETQAPNLLDVNIFKQSGHFDHYKENMFFTKGSDEKEYALKPMDCPGTIQIYKYYSHSYKELPLRYSEYGTVTRNEKSGELNGLLRVAQITQDDAHIFVRTDQIQNVVEETMKLAEEIYKPFNLSYKIYLSTRPDDFMGDIKIWNQAELALKNAMKSFSLPLLLKEKDGAFYGPKIDYQLQDSLGRSWQCGTIQLDFQMPEVFNLNYIGEDGKEHRPVIIHRTIMGAIERFIGILIEHYKGAFPLWLSPVQVAILPVSDKFNQEAQKVKNKLLENNLRVELNIEKKPLGAKIRSAVLQKIPYLCIIGEKECDSLKNNNIKEHFISVRTLKGENLGLVNFYEFINNLKEKIENKFCS